MVRQLKHHEKKLLKKVDFLNVRAFYSLQFTAHALQWKQDANVREIRVMRRYHIQHRDDYHKYVPPRFPFSLTACSRYNKLCGTLRSFAHRLSVLPAQDPFRATMEGQLLSKLYDMGVLNSQAKLSDLENKLTVAAFCRRRLAVFVCMSKMAETVSAVCLSPPSLVPIHQHASCRPRNSSNRVISVSDQTPSRILHSSLHGV